MDTAHPVCPLPWWQVALVILPGVVVLPTLPTGDGTGYVFAAIVLVMLIAGVVWQREGQLPSWALLLLGIELVAGAGMLSAAVGSLFPGRPTLGAVLLGLLIAVLLTSGLIVAVRHLRAHPLPPAIRWLLPLMLGLALAGGVLTGLMSLLAGSDPFDPAAISALLMMGLWHVGLTIVMLVPVALGLPLARRYGLLALLFVVGCLYPIYYVVLDPNYGLSIWTDRTLIIWIVELAAPALMLVVGPLWMLRAASMRGRVLGLLIPLAVTFAVGAIIPPLVRDYATGLSLASAGLQALSLLLIVVVAALLYRDASDSSAPSLVAEIPTP
jgi:hypothetical protein